MTGVHGLKRLEKVPVELMGTMLRGAVLRWVAALISAVVLACTGPVDAQEIGREANGWLAHSWDTGQGLPESTATAIVQDEAGYLWFGTFRGLVRFDGARMKVFQKSGTPQLHDDAIINLHRDRAARMWISTSKGITVMEPDGSFDGERYSVGWPRDSYVRWWYEATDGVLYAVTFKRELMRFTAGRWEMLPTLEGIADGGVHLYEETPGRLVAVTPNRDFEWKDGAWADADIIDRERDGRLVMTCVAKDGGWWFATQNALVHRKDGVETLRRPMPLWTDALWSMTEDAAGNIWQASYRFGMQRINPSGSTERFDASSALRVMELRVVFQDRQGVIWVGTSGAGLVRLQPRIVRSLGEAERLSHPSIQALFEERDGTVLIGTQGGGVFRWNGRNFVRPSGPEWTEIQTNTPFVSSILREPDGALWIAGGNGIVYRLKDSHLTRESPIIGQSPWVERMDLFQGKGRRLWLGFDQGLMVRERDGWRRVGADNPYMTHIQSFAQATEGGPVFAASKRSGLFMIEGGSFRRYGTNDGLPSEAINALYLGSAGDLWIATERGLARWRNGTIGAVRPENDLDVEGLGQMLEDDQGRLWMATPNGVVVAELSDINDACDGGTNKVPHRHFTRADGLPQNDFHRSAVKLKDGTLWFGTIRGIAAIEPIRFRSSSRKTGVRIEEVAYSTGPAAQVRRILQVAPTGGHLVIPPGSRRILVQFTGFDSAASHLLGFEYQIVGRDPGWLPARDARSVEFEELPPGGHLLRIRATNADGYLDPQEATVVLDVEPFYWETWWFRGLALVGLGAVIALGATWVEGRRLSVRKGALAREEALLRERADAVRQQLLFRRLLDQSNEGIFVLDPRDGRFLDANESSARMLGYEQPELLRMKADEIAVPERPLDWGTQIRELRSRGRLVFESRQRRKDGSLLAVEVDLRLANIAGSEFVISFITDITERREAREKQAALEHQLREAQKMEAIGCLAGGVAHDFNNLLQAIGGFAELARMDSPPRERDEHLAEIGRTVARATQLTRQLLAFSRKHEAEMQEIDLGEIVERSIRLLSRLVGATVRIRFHATPSLARIHGDAGLIDQILLNLAVNARDAMPDGGELDISTGEAYFGEAGTPSWARPGRFVRLTVADTGVGIDPALFDRIFEPFFTTKPQGKGTGLGLSVVYGNVQQHDGFIRVDSAPGRGTTFEIYFPALATAEAVKPENRDQTPRAAGGVILFCDDEPGVRKVGRMILESAGYSVVVASEGAEAVRIHGENPTLFSLIIMDVMMPGMNGPEAVRKIREVRDDVPVLFISGFSGSALSETGGMPDNAALLPKPYSRADLLEAVARHILTVTPA
jgi:PAS domain S-box-containing protein